MIFKYIIFQSAGSLSVAILALLMMILQALLFFKKPKADWFGWSAAISFSAVLYSVGIFLEYNTVQGSLNRFSGLLEFTAIICLIHFLYGFTFSYLGIESKRYHFIAGTCHGLILILLWFTNYIVAERFITRNFIALGSPYFEPALGPLGAVFVLYATIASLNAMIVWIRNKKNDPNHRIAFLAGMSFWILLGIHDGVASMGFPAFQYLMEYGFMGFALAVLWVVFNSYLEIEAEEKYRVITEFANDCILVVQDGKTVFGNPACCDLADRPLIGSAAGDIFDIMLPEDREAVLKHYNILLGGGCVPNPYTACILKENGEKRYIEIASSLIQYRNRPAVLAIMRDITERKREEEARQESERKLAVLSKMKSLGLLAGGVAHDLNNVLSGIVSYPELILMDLPENSKLRKPVEVIKDSGIRAAAIVQDLITVARGVSTPKEALNINDLIADYLQSPEFNKLRQFHPLVAVKTDLDTDLLNINASYVHIRKVVMNLVSNASEAIEVSGEVTISTMNRYIDRPLRGYDTVNIGEYAVLAVSDDGLGISSDALERIFEPFYTKKVMGRSGTGLGLAVVWNVVQDHNGYIDVKSNENGTMFELYFPVTREEPSNMHLSSSIENLKGNGEKILVVDDVESQREITCKMLDRLGYEARAVSDGEKAVEYLKEHAMDLIVLDMIMDPGISGRETYERIIEIHPNQKAIIASGFAETDDVRETQKLGAGRYLKKPLTLEKIGIAVREELKKQHG